MNSFNHIEAISFSNERKVFSQILFVSMLIGSFSNILIAQENTTFTVGSIAAEPGEKVSGKIIVEDGIDKGTFIPITIINGIKPGPVLTLNAGIHGTEYVPIITLQTLLNEINPNELSGAVILVHIANIPSFLGRAVYTSPIDNKNLNRVFPGKKDGTVCERIAYTLSNEIMSKSDYFIDMHGGEFNERLVDFLYFYYNCPDPELCKKTEILAHATGNKYLIPYDYNLIPDTSPSEYSDIEAMRQGAAAITLELGDRGIALQEEIAFCRKGIINVFKTLGMLPGEPIVNNHAIYIYNINDVNSNFNGILYTLVDKGQFITRGTLIGYTTDYWGNVLEEYYSPITGIIKSVKVSPAINKDEKVFSVAEASDKYKE